MNTPASALKPGQTYAMPFGSRRLPRTVVSVSPVARDVAGMRLNLVEITHRAPSGEIAKASFVPNHQLQVLS